jgi:hypothetical protein
MAASGNDKKLLRAAGKGNLEEIEKLLAAGANIETVGGFFSLGQTPLVQAIWYDKTEAVKLLLKKGANPEAIDMSGDTALWVAVSMGRNDAVALLLEYGADPRRRCVVLERHLPLKLAQEKKNRPLVEMLEKGIAAANEKDRAARDRVAQERVAREREEIEAERRKNNTTVIFSQPLGDRTLEEVYNFAALERTTLVRKGEEGPVEAVTRQKFSDIGEPGLRAAFTEHVRLGGTVDERTVFPDAPLKMKALPRSKP